MNVRNAITVVTAVCCCISASAAAGESVPELRAVAARMRAIKTLQVSMHQQKEMSVFGEVIKSTGTLTLARPRRMVMDLEGPGGTRLVIDGNQMSMHYKALNKTERFDLTRDPRAKAIADHMFLLLDADPDALSGTYGIEVTARSPLRVRLVPQPAALRKLIRHVDIRFDHTQLIAELVIQEENGDVTRWLFTNPVVNEEIEATRFALDG